MAQNTDTIDAAHLPLTTMKNYKHVSKSNNAMKLAAVASAAVMLAPVAMSSVSSFATGVTANKVAYPAYDVLSVASAYKAGTGLNLTAPYLFADGAAINTAIQNVLAINVAGVKNSSTQYFQQTKDIAAPVDKARTNNQNAVKQVVSNPSSIFHQMGQSSQNEYKVGADQIVKNSDTLDQTYGAQWDDAAKKAVAAEKARAVYNYADKGYVVNSFNDAGEATNVQKKSYTIQEVANYKAAFDSADLAWQAAVKAIQTTGTTYVSYMDAVHALAEKLAPLTNNGAVNNAAVLAAKAIYAMPAGANRDAATKSFNSIMGTYRAATRKDVSGMTDTSDGVKNADAIDAAAEVAVKALMQIASDNADNSASKQIGVATVNYNPNYGIQIWNKAGQIVRFDAKDAASWNTLHPNNKVKVGDAKKLQGQTSWKIFKNTYTANGTTYYNLGGDQYIDAAYVTVK